jgi:hypothetical protein
MPKQLVMEDGTVIPDIPDEYTDDQMRQLGAMYKLKKGSPGFGGLTPPGQPSVNQAPPTDTPNALKSNISDPDVMAHVATGALPMLGSLFGPEGTIAGSLARQAMGQILPQGYGGDERPTDIPSAMGNVALGTGEDLLAQEGIPRVVNKIMNAVREPRQAIANLLSSKMFNWHPAVSNAVAQDTIDSAMPQVTQTIQDVHGPERSAVRSLMSKGYSETAGTIDPDKILKEFDNPKSDYSAIQGDTKKNITDLMNTVKDAQASKTGSSNVLNSFNRHLAFEAPWLVGGLITGHEVAGAAGAGAIVLGDKAISKLMSDPVTAKMVVLAAKTPKTNEATPLLQKYLVNALKGTEVYVMNSEGKKEPAQIGQDGQLVSKPPVMHQ